ncbi:MAG: AmmeMemoRadiSam system protein B [Chthoniobacterales bacterium]
MNAETNQQNFLRGLRKTRFAGSWYESDPLLLEQQLDAFLKKATIHVANNSGDASSAIAIVAPHAGYAYCGEVAACAYYAARSTQVKRVILLGPSHYVAFHGIGLSMETGFETPLGSIPLDQATITLLREHYLFGEQEEAHRLEHSLEMQLPFIKKVFEEALLMPLLVGHLKDETEIREVVAFLKSFFQQGDLIVVSSDFTHYGPRFQYTPFSDHVQERIKQLDTRAYDFLKKLDLSGFLQFQKESQHTICGFYPLALLLAMLPAGTKASLLAHKTSQDVALADPEHSVSYMAIAFS